MNQLRDMDFDDAQSIASLRSKVDLSVRALGDVRRILDDLNGTVRIIKVFEVEIQHLSKNHESLNDSVKSVELRLAETMRELRVGLERSIEELDREVSSAKTAADTVQRSVDSKMNFLRGALYVLTLVGGLAWGLLMYNVKGYAEKVEQASEYIQMLRTLQAEEHLRAGHGTQQSRR